MALLVLLVFSVSTDFATVAGCVVQFVVLVTVALM
jgi:hypothetical protein